MVTIEQLEALDLVMWWRSGAAAALYCLCDESSITRRVRSTLKTFALKLVRKQEFQLTGDQGLLRLQRVVHQQARFCNHRPLRLEATHYISRQLTRPPVQGWMMGPCHHRGYGTLLSLLQERIIDAWVTSDLLDLPESPEFTVFKLWEWPGDLVVHPCHPLARERRPSRSDLDRFPSLILPESLYPKLTKAVQGKGFGQGRQLSRYDVGCWQGLTEDAVTITYGSCLSLDGYPNLTRLNWDLGLTGGEALVILSEWREEPAIALLLEDLRLRQLQLQKQHPQLVGLL